MAVFLLAAAGAGAAAPAHALPAELLVARIHLDGVFQINGTLHAIVVDDAKGRGATSVQGEAVGAQWLLERLDSYQTPTATIDEPSGSTRGRWNATAVAIEQVAGRDFLLARSGDATAPVLAAATSDPVTLEPSQVGHVAFGDFLRGTGTMPTAAVGGATRLVGAGTLDARLRGDVSMSLWHFSVATDERRISTGRTQSPIAGAPSPADAAAWRASEQALHVDWEAADLHMRIQDAPSYQLFLGEFTIRGRGEATLVAPAAIDGGRALGEALRLDGAVRLMVRMTPDGHLAVVLLEADNVLLDGRSVMLAKGDGVDAGIALAAGAAGVVVVAGAGFAYRRGSVSVRLVALEARLAARDYGWVVAHSRRALKSVKTAPRAALYKATSLLALGQFKEARLFLSGLAPEKRPDAATFHFLTAHAASGLDQARVAAREMRRCLEIEPAYLAEARQIPLLRPIVTGAVTRRARPDGGYS